MCVYHRTRVLVGPVGQHHDMIAEPINLARILRRDDQCPKQAPLFLELGMAVIPIGTGLPQIESVGEGLARRDGRLRHEGYAVHGIGQQDAMPVNRGLHVHLVVDADHGVVPLGETQGRPRQQAIDRHRLGGLAGEVHLLPGNGEVVFHRTRPHHRHLHKQRQAA